MKKINIIINIIIGIIIFSSFKITEEYFELTVKTTKLRNEKGKVQFLIYNKDGTYDITVHHDENKNKKIDKEWFLPIGGIGLSNLKKINLANRSNFNKASFLLNSNETKIISII